MTREEALARLRRLGRESDTALDIGEAALTLAALDRPGVALDWYRAHLADLVRAVGEAAHDSASAAGRAAALRTVFVDRYGYAGDTLTYDDLQNANLIRVIDRRKGLPVALGILYIHAGRAQGWDIAGLAFPGHFMIALEAGGARTIVDPFNGGRTPDAAELRKTLKESVGAEAELEPAHYATVGPREVLMRLENNIKLRLVRQDKFRRAAAVVEAMLALAPDNAPLWREAGILAARAGNLAGAIVALEEFLLRGGPDSQRHEAAALLQQLRAKLQ